MSSWLNSLSGYLIIRVIPLLAILIALLAGIASYFSQTLLTQLLHDRHQELAERFEDSVESTLKGAEDQMLAIAQNDLIINGLIDAEEREKYIPTFIRSWKVSGLLESNVALLDYKGRYISSNVAENFLKGVKDNWQDVVFDQEKVFKVLDATGLFIIVPVRYQYGVEGAIALKVPNKDLDSLFAYEAVDYYVKFSDSNQETILDTYKKETQSRLDLNSDEWFIHEYISSLGTIYTVQKNEQAFSSIDQANSILLLSAILVLFVSGFVIVLAARQTASTVSNLSESIKKITHTGELDARINDKDKPTELNNLADEFNGMLKTLEDSTTSKKRMYEIVDSIGEFLLVVNNEFKITLTNQSLSQFLLDLRIKSGEEIDALFGSGGRLFSDSWIESWNQKYQMESGEHIIQWDRAVYHTHEGTKSGFIFVGKDVTEAIAKEEELRTAKIQAEHGSRVKSEFLANMSHEIRTPMNAIIGMNDLILSTELVDRQRDYVNKSQKAAKNLLGLLNDILDFSKIEAGKLDVERISFDVYDVLDSLADIVGVRLQEKNVMVYFEIDESLPRYLIGDPLRLNQILINLISNALKFTEDGHVSIALLTRNLSDDWVELDFIVTDTGIGIHPTKLSDLFTPFTQADGSTTRQFGGTGLGLSISKLLAELMGGDIKAQSEEGMGSCFSVTLPFQKDRSQESFSIPETTLKAQLKISDMRTAQGMTKILNKLNVSIEDSQLDSGHLEERSCVFIDDEYLSKNEGELRKYKENQIRVVLFSLHSSSRLQTESVRDLVTDIIQLPITFLTFYRYFFNENALQESTQLVDLTECQILLVDDNMINREIAKELLEQVHADIDEAENGVEAYEKACSHSYNIVLMDIQMPIMDGYEASARIHEQLGPRAPKIIAMTAKAMDEDREQAQACGMVGYISKPFDKQKLYQTVLSIWKD